jgi:type I restriction enzyme S subunit
MSLMRIDEIFNFEKGVLQSSKCVPGEYDFITASSDWKTHNEYTHDCEALIFAAAASGSLGRTHYVNGKFVSSDLCFIITPKDQENLPVDLKFYHILFNELKDEIVRNTKAGTSKEAIGLGSFGKYELPYFDIDTQIEIKNQFVNSEDIKSSLTTELNQQVGLVKKLRQQLLQDAVQGKLGEQNIKDEPASELLKKIKAEKEKLIAEKKLKKEKELPPIKSEEIPFEIPENWVWCRLGEVVSHIFDGPFGSHLKSSDYKNSGVQVIRLQNLGVMKFKEEKESFVSIEKYNTIKQHTVYEGDIIIGSFLADGVNCVILPKLNYTAIAKADCFTIRISHLNVIKRFVMFLLSSEPMFKELSKLLRGMTRLRINTTQLKNLPIPLPPLAEQNRIVQKLNELMQYCNELEESIKQSESQNEKLLQQVLREALRQEPVEA